MNDPDAMRCPVVCPMCDAFVELDECFHTPNCTRCRSDGTCDNLVCRDCLREMDEEDEQ